MTGSGGWTVGLDIGGTKVLGVLLDPSGTVRESVRVPSRPGTGGVLDTATAVVGGLCAAAGSAVGELAAVGIGVPGLVDPRTGVVAHAVNLGITEPGVALAPLLEDRLGGVPVVIENDLNVAAVGAARVLGLHGDLAFLGLGTGLAAGLLLGGHVRRGFLGAAGEIGHITYDPTGPVCRCGQRGCLELYASGSALDGAWVCRDGLPAAAEVFSAARRGDPAGRALRDTFADAAAAAVRLLVLACDVEHVVLGGGVAEVGRPLLEAVARKLRDQAQSSPFLRALAIDERLELMPPGTLVAPIGAALAATEMRAVFRQHPLPT